MSVYRPASQPTIAIWNGKECLLETLNVPIEDRSMFFGDAVYEVIRIYNGRLWLASEHFMRLERSLAKIQIQANVDEIIRHSNQNVAANDISEGYIYLQVSRGTAPRNHSFPSPGTMANVLIYSKHFREDPWHQHRSSGISVILQPDIRWLGRDIKSTNLLPNCIAKQAADDAGCQEAIFYESDGIITEATANNVFIVKDNILITAPADSHILGGITRAYLIARARQHNIEVNERRFAVAELVAADEVFITGSTSEILDVREIDGQKVGKTDWPIFLRLRDLFSNDIRAITQAQTSIYSWSIAVCWILLQYRRHVGY
jgi:D-alanine transaminase